MSSQLGKQIIAGIIVGGLLSGGIFYLMGSTREEIQTLKADNEKLDMEVKKGYQLKASYEVLKKEVEEQEKRIAELIKLFPTDLERARVAYMVQKLASASALGQVQGWVNSDKPVKREYYMEYPATYKYSGGFHEFGRFLSNISGYEKIINISDMVMTRQNTKSISSAAIEFRLLIYVYDPTLDKKSTAKATAAAAKPAGNNED